MSKHGCGMPNIPDKSVKEKTAEDFAIDGKTAAYLTDQGIEDSYKKAINSLDRHLVIELFNRIRYTCKAGKSEVLLTGLNDQGEENSDGGNNLSDDVKKKITEVLSRLGYSVREKDSIISVTWTYLC